MNAKTKAEYDSQPEQKKRRQEYNKKYMREHYKEYHKQYHLKTKYDLTIDAYNFLLQQQENRCAICLTHISELNKPLDVDHDHNTGKVRGLLCGACNRGLGQLKDDYTRVLAAANYLLKHNGGGQ